MMTPFERSILAELREITGNRKLKERDLLEWCTGPISERPGEKVLRLPLNGVWVAYPDAPVKAAKP